MASKTCFYDHWRLGESSIGLCWPLREEMGIVIIADLARVDAEQHRRLDSRSPER
jgi:hypothetical protein